MSVFVPAAAAASFAAAGLFTPPPLVVEQAVVLTAMKAQRIMIAINFFMMGLLS